MSKRFDNSLYVYGLVVLVGVYAFTGVTEAISFLLGFATSVFTYRLLSNSTRNSLLLPEGSRASYVMKHQLMRFAVYFVILLGAAFTEQIEIVYTFVGLLSVKIVMFIYILLKKEEDE